MATCKSCQAHIVWGVTKRGKAIPLNAEPSERGTWCYLDGTTWPATDEDRARNALLYVPHWADCTAAHDHRRAR